MAASEPNPDFLKIELCRHGWTCRHRQAGDCSYAHVLHELRPPNESCRPYPGVWRDGVDRFYGQRMGREQIERIKTYYNEAPRCDRPMWSHALYWYVSERGSFDDYPYDFGLEQDWKSVCMFRVPSKQPFEWAPRLWDRIEQRRIRLTTQVYRALPTPPFPRDDSAAALHTVQYCISDVLMPSTDQHEPVPVTATSTNKIKWSSVSMDDDGMNLEDVVVKTGNVELLHGPTMVSADVEEHDVRPKLTLASVSIQTQTDEGEVSPIGDAIVGEVSAKFDSGNLSIPAGDCMIIETPEREIPRSVAASPGIDDDMSF